MLLNYIEGLICEINEVAIASFDTFANIVNERINNMEVHMLSNDSEEMLRRKIGEFSKQITEYDTMKKEYENFSNEITSIINLLRTNMSRTEEINGDFEKYISGNKKKEFSTEIKNANDNIKKAIENAQRIKNEALKTANYYQEQSQNLSIKLRQYEK